MTALLEYARGLPMILGLLLAFLSNKHVQALDLDIRRSTQNDLDFSMLISHENLTLINRHHEVDTELNRIGVLVYDVPASGVHLGLNVGYAFVSQSQQPLTEGQDMDGFFLGVSLRSIMLSVAATRVWGRIDYLFQDVKSNVDTQHVSLTSNELSAQVLFAYDFYPWLTLQAGVEHGWINVTQKARGDVSQTLRLEPQDRSGFVLGINYQLDQLESVGIQYHNHYQQGVTLQFQRWF